MGNAATDNESAIPVSWQTAGGQQGELFSGITPGGIVVAERGTPQSDDPFTATFAVASVVGQQPSQGAYAGTIRLVASAL